MKVLILTAIAVLAGVVFPGKDQSASAEDRRVGEIMIVGNESTSSREILKLLDFYPGQSLPPDDKFRAIERQLFRKFRTQFAEGKRPRIQVEADDSVFRTIIIHFPEKEASKIRKQTLWFLDRM